MKAILKQLRRARRRMVLRHFTSLASAALVIAWSFAAIAIVAAAVWVLPLDPLAWRVGWIAGATLLALAIALLVALVSAPSLDRVAGEVDARFGLNERLSSALALAPQDRETTMGQALIGDARRRAKPLEVPEQFPLAPQRAAWWPLVPAAVLAAALLLPAATPQPADPATTLSATLVAQSEQTEAAAEVLRRKVQQQRRGAEAAGLEDAEDFFQQLEIDLQKLTSRPASDRKEAMVAMNDIKKQLDQRRHELGTPDQLRRTLAKLESLPRGPAEEIVKAIENGEFAEAQKQVAALADQLRSGELSDQQLQDLAQQTEALRDQLRQAIAQHEQAKEQLRQQLEQAKQDGRSADAAKLQEQLNQLAAQDQQMQAMEQMAEAMDQAASALQNGQSGEAAESLQAMSDSLGQLQTELDQLQELDETLEAFSQSKNQMLCQACSGGGCGSCSGSGSDSGGSEGGGTGGSGDGVGLGQGQNGSPNEPPDTGSYASQVRGEPRQGRGIIAGVADGPNRRGVSRQEIKQAIGGVITDQSDPLENPNLPRAERDHARQYFDRLRQGQAAAAAAAGQ